MTVYHILDICLMQQVVEKNGAEKRVKAVKKEKEKERDRG